MIKANPVLFCFGLIVGAFTLISRLTFGCDPSRALVVFPGPLPYELTWHQESLQPRQPDSSYSRIHTEVIASRYCHYLILRLEELTPRPYSKGAQALDEIERWIQQQPSLKSVELNLLAHSVHGFDALEAMSLHSQRPGSLPIHFKKLFLIGTPLKGIALGPILEANPLVATQLKQRFSQALGSKGLDSGFLDNQALNNDVLTRVSLDSFLEFSPEKLDSFYKTLRLPEDLEIHLYGAEVSYATSTPPAPSPLSAIFSAFDFLMDEPNDGLVQRTSALAKPGLLNSDGQPFRGFYPHPEMTISLQHLETYWDEHLLQSLRVTDIDGIREKQREFIKQILQ